MSKTARFSFVMVLGLWTAWTCVGLSQGAKIGFVDSLAVLQGTDEGKAGIGEVEKFVQAKQKELQALQTQVEDLKAKLNEQARVLSPEAAAQMQQQISENETKLRRNSEDSQAEVGKKRDALLGKMSSKIQVIIKDYAQKNGYSVIFLREQNQPYVAPSLDVTQEIVRIYNAQNPVGAAAASSPTAQ